jgi:hypothetical protein
VVPELRRDCGLILNQVVHYADGQIMPVLANFLGYISPQCANGGSCGSPIEEVLVLVLIVGGLIVGVVGWVYERWHRGPLAWLVRGLRRVFKTDAGSDDPFGNA